MEVINCSQPVEKRVLQYRVGHKPDHVKKFITLITQEDVLYVKTFSSWSGEKVVFWISHI